MNISKPSTVSEEEEEEFDDSDEEKLSNKSFGEEDDGQAEGLEMRVGVTPFLSGVLPAGRLVARTKPVGCQAYGLIQVSVKEPTPHLSNTFNMVIQFIFLPFTGKWKSLQSGPTVAGKHRISTPCQPPRSLCHGPPACSR